MRTTLDIEADILQVAKEIAVAEKSSAGAVISRLARQGYHSRTSTRHTDASLQRNGIEMLPARPEPISLEHVQRLLDEEGI